MPQLARTAAIVFGALLLAACAAVPPGVVPTEDSPSESSVGTTGGWPRGVSPGFYMVSEEIAAYCPNGERYLAGAAILEVIPVEAFADLDGFACAFMPTPDNDPELVDEAAYHVDEGLAELVRAYSQTEGLVTVDDCAPDVESLYPSVRVEYEGAGYTVMPSMLSCKEYPDVVAAVDALVVTEVARATSSFDDYLAGDF